jgi:hypothetical protein
MPIDPRLTANVEFAIPKRKVQRRSPHRLLREKLVLPGGVIVSAEMHKGRLVVRVEVPEGEQ